MTNTTSSYNLVDEEWIPVLWNNGKFSRVGIRTALTQAGRIRQIAASNPMDRFAILRFLLAVLYWCKGNPPDTLKPKLGSGFPAEWFDKLETERECFNLLGNGTRFYQRFQKEAKKEKAQTVNYLIHEIPTGTNSNHFRRSTDYIHGLCPACIAIGLVRLPVFATSGGRGKPPGINSKPPFYVVPVGATLGETLELNWIPRSNLGEPSWLQKGYETPREMEVPLLNGLTWLPRKVWLNDPKLSESCCISCGSKNLLIYDCIFAGVGTTKEQGSERIWRDPHVLYLESKKREIFPIHSANSLNATDSGAAKWTNLYSPVLEHHGLQKNLNPFWAVGFSTVQNDKYLEVVEHTILPNEKSDDLEKAILFIKAWEKNSSKLVHRLKSILSRSISRKESIESRSLIDSFRPHIENITCMNFNKRDSNIITQNNRLVSEIIAIALSPGLSIDAELRRNRIKNLIPSFQLVNDLHDSSHSSKGNHK